MATFNVKEESDKMYVYCSKNAVSDIAASVFFGKAAAWVSGGTYSSGDRVTSSSIQYRNFTGVNTTTAPASDTANWVFDLDNYQSYLTTKNYVVGSKTNYNNEHYICITNTSGTFDITKWTKQIISNRDVPYKLQNTAINLINSDARFVSYELLDYTNNVAYHNIYCILSNGIWAETLTNPTKYIRFVGQSNLKTQMLNHITGFFYDNMYIYSAVNFNIFKCNSCMFYSISSSNNTYYYYTFSFFYKNVVQNTTPSCCYVYHFNNNTLINGGLFYEPITYYANTVIRNNIIKGVSFMGSTYMIQRIPLGNFDYNCYCGIVYIDGVAKSTLVSIQSATVNQNIYSVYNTNISLNPDYTLPVGSPLIKTGSNGNNIGAEGVGYPQTNSGIFDSLNGAVYKNITKYGTTLTRQQISKQAQGGGNNYITLESAASSVNFEYNGFRIYISSGTGVGQTRTILTYNASTKDATVDLNWTINPDSTSIYEILDGEITSSVGDLGSVQTVKKLLIQATNFYDATGYILTQSVSETDCRLDNPAALTFDLRVSNSSDLSAVSYRRFVQDEFLKIDSNDKGCGDSAYSCANLVSSVLSFRYFQIRLMLRK